MGIKWENLLDRGLRDMGHICTALELYRYVVGNLVSEHDLPYNNFRFSLSYYCKKNTFIKYICLDGDKFIYAHSFWFDMDGKIKQEHYKNHLYGSKLHELQKLNGCLAWNE